MDQHILWVEKYRPKTVKECILPESLKETFQEYVNRKEIPNLILSGSAEMLHRYLEILVLLQPLEQVYGVSVKASIVEIVVHIGW